MMRSWLLIMAGCFLAATSSGLAWGAEPPRPGTVNYIEGQASAGGQTLTEKSVGSVTLVSGETLATQNGRAEVLLTPGIFLRVDNHSSVQMVSPGLADTVVQLQNGRALVEVAEIRKENNVRVNMGNVSTQVLKAGLYDFDANQGLVEVFDGKALVQGNDRRVEVSGGQEVAVGVANQNLKKAKFDKKANEDDFYRWASLRSSYLAEANFDAARRYVVNSGWGAGWYGSGWYWDPWFDAYTFIPAYGAFFGPFGYGFYSPFVVYGAPYFGFGGYYRHFGPGYRPPVVARGFAGHAFSGGGRVGTGRVGGFSAGPGGGFGGRTGGFGRSGGFGGRR